MKNSNKILYCVALAILLPISSNITAGAQKELPASQKKVLRYPLLYAGIKAGGSTDADVQSLYGKGYFVANEDHLGGRYYVDPKQNVTLHTEIGTDRIIDAVEYQQGIHLPGKATKDILRQATTALPSSIDPTNSVLAFGATVHDLLEKYGKPKKDTKSDTKRTLRYETDYTVTKDVLFYAAEFRFQKDHLVYIRLEEGE